MNLDFQTGQFSGGEAQTRRTLGELAGIFSDNEIAKGLFADRIVYETFGSPPDIDGTPRLLYATTVLQPGKVGREFFMTRGHFHEDPLRGELMFTLGGQGALILMDRNRQTWKEDMQKGSVHDIDGRFAHRVANTGAEPLVFLVAWMSDCGHDYESIRENGFGSILIEGPAGPDLLQL